MSDKIEKSTDLNAPGARVWKALTDHAEFGRWFRAKLENPFVPGETTRGHITYPGYEHVKLALNVVAMERRFEAYRSNEQGWTMQMTNIAEHVDHAG
jgi:uncharacterized protein YndB with AHSA1/START domain